MTDVRLVADRLGYKLGKTLTGILDKQGRFLPLPEDYYVDSPDIPKVTLKVVSIDYANKVVTLNSEV